jgi:probable addiction module antidote protein
MDKQLFNELLQSLKEAVLISKGNDDGRARRTVIHADATAEWLKSDTKNVIAFLNAAIETGDVDDLKAALRLVAKAKGGVTKIANDGGLKRESLYRALSWKIEPTSSSLMQVLRAMGFKLVVQVMRSYMRLTLHVGLFVANKYMLMNNKLKQAIVGNAIVWNATVAVGKTGAGSLYRHVRQVQ